MTKETGNPPLTGSGRFVAVVVAAVMVVFGLPSAAFAVEGASSVLDAPWVCAGGPGGGSVSSPVFSEWGGGARYGRVWVPHGATVSVAIHASVTPQLGGSHWAQLQYRVTLLETDPGWPIAGPWADLISGTEPDATPVTHTATGSWTNSGSAVASLVKLDVGVGLAFAGQVSVDLSVSGGDRSGCVDSRFKRGGGLASVGDVEDPVNTFTGSFTESRTDLAATAGLFGMDWTRSYDSGGTVGDAVWGYSFSDRLDELPSGDVELVLPSSRVVAFRTDGSGGFQRPVEYDGRLATDGTGWRLDFSDGSSKSFDSAGKMTSWSSWDGQDVTATYTAGLLSGLVSSEGPTLSMTYSAGRLATVTSSDGRSVSYGYDMFGHLGSVTLPGSIVWGYINDVDGRIEAVTDPTAVTTVVLTYDVAGRVATQTTAAGSVTTFTYHPAAVDVIDVASSTTTTFRYDGLGRLIQVSDAAGKTVDRSYDDFDELTGTTSRLNGSTSIARNSRGLIESVTATSRDTVTVDYKSDGSNRIESVIDAGGTTSYGYDGSERIPSTVTDAEDNDTTLDVVDGLIRSVTDADGVTVEYRYNTLRQLVETEDEYGNITHYNYDSAGRPTGVELPSGAESSVVYDSAGRVWKETAADGGLTTTTYDPAGRVDTVTDGEGGVTDYDYNSTTGLLDQVTDPMSRVTTYDHDVYGDVTTVHHPDTSMSSATYGPLGRLDTSTDEVNRTTTYGYDAGGNVTTTEDPAGGVVESHYDPAGRVDWTDDALDRRTSYVYDDDTGLLMSESSPAGTVSYTYDALGRQRTVTDLRGGVTETHYTPGGRTDWVDDPLDRRTDYSYDNAGRLASVTKPGSLTTTYGYDDDSNVNLVTTPEGNETATVYDGLGRVLTVTDPAGVVRTNTWTKTGQVKTTTTTGAGTVEYSYNPDGTLDWFDDALDHRTSYTYDTRGRLETRTDAESNVWATDYNPAGELASETDPLNRTTAFAYDDAGRLETKSDPSGRTSTLVWELDGQLDTRTDVLGSETRMVDYSYDTVGRRTAAAVTGTSPWPLADTTKIYSYNPAGDLTSESVVSVMGYSARTLSYEYDLAGRRTRLHRVDGSTVDYAYDTAGRVDTLTAGEVAADSFAGVTSGPFDFSKWTVTTTGGATATIADSAGAMAVTSTATSTVDATSLTPATADGNTAVTYKFATDATPTEFRLDERTTGSGDRYSLQLVANSSTAAITKTVSGTTTALGTFSVPVGTDPQRARLQVDGSTVSAKVWDPDSAEPNTWSVTVTDTAVTANGTPGLRAATGAGAANTVTVDDWTHTDPSADPVTLVDYGWDDDSNLASEVFADGGTRDWTWTDGRLTGLDQDIAGAVHTTSLGYDTSGRIDTETVDSATTTYGYDDAGQLTEADPASGPTNTWTYDTLGHRATQTVGSDTTSYSYDDAGQLTAATPASGPATAYTYDDAGRRVTETTGSDVTTFTYNASGQLAQTDLPTGELVWRTTDADGASVGFYTDNSTTIRYQFYDWDTTSGLAELTTISNVGYDATGLDSHTTTLTRAPDTPWATAQTTTSTDAVASDIHQSTITSTATTLAADDSYTPWGQADTTTAQPKLGYHGELTIAGLTHLRARDYEPTTGTFTTTDPLNGIPGTTTVNNPYHYTNNNPLNLTDPTGLRPTDNDLNPFEHIEKFTADHQQEIILAITGITVALLAAPLLPATMSIITAGALLGALSSATVSTINQYSTTGRINTTILARDTATGAALGAATTGISQALPSRYLPTTSTLDDLATPTNATNSALGESGAASPSRIRFSQDSVSATFRGGSSVDDLVSGLRSGAVDPASVPPIRVFEQGGEWFTLDNRRLLAFQEAGVDIPYVQATPAEIAAEAGRKMTTTNGGTSIRVRGR